MAVPVIEENPPVLDLTPPSPNGSGHKNGARNGRNGRAQAERTPIEADTQARGKTLFAGVAQQEKA